MLKDRDDFSKQTDASSINKPEALVPSSSRILDAAKIGWAQPAMLSLEEVQELCKALVILEAETGMVTKAAA